MKKIAIFNHKGGVSKTTTSFNLGWSLSKQGKRCYWLMRTPSAI